MAFAMGRVLILFDVWSHQEETPLDVERAILLDFALQHPRSVKALLPGLDPVIRAHGLREDDFSDLYARRHFATTREVFLAIIVDLVARGLLAQHLAAPDWASHAYAPMEEGHGAAHAFSSSLALALRAIASVLCASWRRKNVADLARNVRQSLPDESRHAAALTEPFAAWLLEPQ